MCPDKNKAGGSRGLLQKEKRMSREDDFDDIVGSPDDLDAAQDDTSEPLLEDESVDESPATDIGYVERARVLPAEPVEEMPAPAARKVVTKKKKATAKPKPKPKPKTKPKPKAKKKTKKAAKPARKPAAKKTAKKPAKKKTKPAAKKKKAGKPRPKK